MYFNGTTSTQRPNNDRWKIFHAMSAVCVEGDFDWIIDDVMSWEQGRQYASSALIKCKNVRGTFTNLRYFQAILEKFQQLFLYNLSK